jgi:hypothetical protein
MILNWLRNQAELRSLAPVEAQQASLPSQTIEPSPTRTSVILSFLKVDSPSTFGDISDKLKEADLQTPRISLLELLDRLVQQEQVIRDWNESGCRVYFLNKSRQCNP